MKPDSDALENRIAKLLSELTLEEKVSMAAGSDMWHSTGVERLGIPALKGTDGPNGARGAGLEGATSACFPCGTALAATWNPDLVFEVGAELGNEVKSKGAQLLLAPTVNIHRSPLAGRNFECFSEDPFLSARIAVAYIQGVGSRGVGTAVKHFVCNDSEFERMSISSEVGERALREIYLPPFEAAVREAGTWSVMSAYNAVNGTPASDNARLLTQILKEEWGFDGFVVSDWYGTKSTVAAAAAGLDLEMPGPPLQRGPKLLQAVRDGEVDEAAIDDTVRRLLRITLRAGRFEYPEEAPERSVDTPEQRALNRRAAGEAIVLLRNQQILPLETSGLRSLAVIGPNAETAVIQGGGSAQVSAHYSVSPLEGIRARCGDEVEVVHEAGCLIHKTLPAMDARWAACEDGAPGLEIEYFSGLDLEGEAVLCKRSREAVFNWFGSFAPEVDVNAFSARLSARFTPTESGRFSFSLTSAGRSRLRIDSRELVDNWTRQTRGESFFGMGSSEVRAEVELEAGRSYLLEVEYSRQDSPLLAGLKVGCLPPAPEDMLERAVAAASAADAAVVVVGLTAEWETEGHDRASLGLPGRQDELIERVAAENSRTVVVVNAGSPVSMDWIEQVGAALQLWYPGQESGNALADLLFGDLNPSGRLPTTFPRRLEDNPTHTTYPGEDGKVLYGEGIFVGYRYYDRKKVDPLFEFGHGLSYTEFEYSALTLNASEYSEGETIELRLELRNSGERAGQEVVQVYLRDLESSRARPERELKAFAKIALEPGEKRSLELSLDRRSLSSYDPAASAFVPEAGEFEVLVGASSRDIRQRARFTLKSR